MFEPISNPQARSLIIIFLTVSSLPYSKGYFEFCSGSKLFTAKYADCPAGIAFLKPVQIPCTYPETLPYTLDVCTGEKYDPSKAPTAGATTGSAPTPTTSQVQVIEMQNDDDPIDETAEPYLGKTCRRPAPAGCGPTAKIVKINSVSSPPADPDDMISSRAVFGSEERFNEIPGVADDDNHVEMQTTRVLLYLNHYIIDEDEQGPRLRITELLKKSFEIFKTHCPNPFVPKIFSEHVLKAFLFLVREGDLAMVRDIDEDDYKYIMNVLTECHALGPAPQVVLNGKQCKTRGILESITAQRAGSPTYTLVRNELSFRWGKYDPPSDAAWSVTDFVHGLCFGQFYGNANKHHLYQRAMERLFTPEIIYRWERPFKLNDPEAWDHAFRTSMKDVMKNLEACVQGAYIGRPFLHRLERPMARFNPAGPNIEFAPPSIRTRRRKRAAEAAILEEPSGNVFCFQDVAEKQKTIDLIKKISCTATEKPAEEAEVVLP